MQGHHVESFQTVASDGLKEPTRLLWGERVDFFGVYSWRVHVVGGVLCHVSPSHGLLQSLVQRLVHLVNRRGATPSIEPGAVEARHVRRTKSLELFSTQRGYQVNATKGFVPIVGALADTAAHGVFQPTGQECAHGLWATVAGDPLRGIRHRRC